MGKKGNTLGKLSTPKANFIPTTNVRYKCICIFEKQLYHIFKRKKKVFKKKEGCIMFPALMGVISTVVV